MTIDTPQPEPRYERFIAVYATGTAIECFYPGAAVLREAQVSHPLAQVETIEDSLVGVGSRS